MKNRSHQFLWIVITPKGKIIGAGITRKSAQMEADENSWNFYMGCVEGFITKKIAIKLRS